MTQYMHDAPIETPPKIAGYRTLNADEIALINEIKHHGQQIQALVDRLAMRSTPREGLSNEAMTDARWVSIGRTHLQQGFMALTRAVAKPNSF